jgi:multicomponent Na+:H+ antiporter subunit F
MHTTVFYFAAFWMTILLGATVILVIRARSAMVRILALDTVTLILVALVILYSDARKTSYYLDAGLMLALLSFVSTLAAARYASGRGVFPE